MARPAQRPTKYTPERVKSILSDLAAGIPKQHAAIRAGVSDQTLLNWEHKYPEFAAGIRKAEADAVARNVALIQRAAQDGTWQAAAWWLERRHPEEFGRRDRLSIEYEAIIEDTRQLAESRGVDPDAAVAEAEVLLGIRHGKSHR